MKPSFQFPPCSALAPSRCLGLPTPLPPHQLPPGRGTLSPNRPLADLTWLRVGGPADYLFQPADLADLQQFMTAPRR